MANSTHKRPRGKGWVFDQKVIDVVLALNNGRLQDGDQIVFAPCPGGCGMSGNCHQGGGQWEGQWEGQTFTVWHTDLFEPTAWWNSEAGAVLGQLKGIEHFFARANIGAWRRKSK